MTKRDGADAGRLSEREAQVMNLLCRRLSQKAVADSLRISYGTAGTYIARLYLKMNVHTRAEAVAKWLSGRREAAL